MEQGPTIRTEMSNPATILLQSLLCGGDGGDERTQYIWSPWLHIRSAVAPLFGTRLNTQIKEIETDQTWSSNHFTSLSQLRLTLGALLNRTSKTSNQVPSHMPNLLQSGKVSVSNQGTNQGSILLNHGQEAVPCKNEMNKLVQHFSFNLKEAFKEVPEFHV